MKCEKETMLLYAVTDRMWTGKQTLMEQVEDALKGGATCVQLREKELDEENFLKEAIEMKALCAKYGVPFIVNDNVEIAIKCKADGIHVGQSDMEALDVRAKLGPGKIVGVSAQTVEQGVVERVQQRAARPLENGLRPGAAASVRPDVAAMTRAQREALERRVLHGAQIEL